MHFSDYPGNAQIDYIKLYLSCYSFEMHSHRNLLQLFIKRKRFTQRRQIEQYRGKKNAFSDKLNFILIEIVIPFAKNSNFTRWLLLSNLLRKDT